MVQKVIDDKENKSEGTPSSNPQHDDETYVQKSFGSSSKYRKVLRINWDTRTDNFVFEFANIVEAANRLQVTKRNILKISAIFFDPLGVVCPIVLNAKVLLQETCKQKLSWDAVIPIDINNKRKVFINELFNLDKIETKRHVLCCGKQEIELHGFCNASTLVYGAVVYVRSVCEHGVKVCFWTAKSCVVLTKVHTVPRLELMGSVLLSKLVVSVKLAVEKMLKVTEVVCYSDSQIVLWWLKLIRKDWKLWVENRAQIVRKNVEPENWFYVPTDRNPADLATRLKSTVCLKGCLLWWQGPDVLQSQEVVMPSQQFLEPDVFPEQKGTVVAKCEKIVGVGEVIDCCRFSFLGALLRITGYALRFIYNLKM